MNVFTLILLRTAVVLFSTTWPKHWLLLSNITFTKQIIRSLNIKRKEQSNQSVST